MEAMRPKILYSLSLAGRIIMGAPFEVWLAILLLLSSSEKECQGRMQKEEKDGKFLKNRLEHKVGNHILYNS